jgi:hypothetical protein
MIPALIESNEPLIVTVKTGEFEKCFYVNALEVDDSTMCYDHGLATRGRRNDVDLIWPRSML